MKREAKFWKPIENKKIQCHLCSHNCKINDGKIGICGIRKNEQGKLYTLIYGSCSSLAADPIEKKPLYHFHPGTQAYSLGTIGCNFKCLHCQNYSISTADSKFPYIRDITPEQVVQLAQEHGCRGIAWTYNEPTIWHEFAFDASKLAKKAGLYTVYVSNGYISEEPLKELSQYLDAINVDVKAFQDEFYKRVCKARLELVLNTCERAKELGIHLETTYLVIPGMNDSVDEVKNFCKWVLEKLGPDTPVHFSRFHPDHDMTNISATPFETLSKIYELAKEIGLLYVYLGNLPPGNYENTYCPSCGALCIERQGYTVRLKGLKDGSCAKCGANISVRFD